MRHATMGLGDQFAWFSRSVAKAMVRAHGGPLIHRHTRRLRFDSPDKTVIARGSDRLSTVGY